MDPEFVAENQEEMIVAKPFPPIMDEELDNAIRAHLMWQEENGWLKKLTSEEAVEQLKTVSNIFPLVKPNGSLRIVFTGSETNRFLRDVNFTLT